jgi:WD40 repeat protein
VTRGRARAWCFAAILALLWPAAGAAGSGLPVSQPGGVDEVAFAPDGELLASRGHDGDVRVWRVADGVLVGEIAGPYEVLWWDGRGDRLLLAHSDGRVAVWRVEADVLELEIPARPGFHGMPDRWRQADPAALADVLEGRFDGLDAIRQDVAVALAEDRFVRVYRGPEPGTAWACSSDRSELLGRSRSSAESPCAPPPSGYGEPVARSGERLVYADEKELLVADGGDARVRWRSDARLRSLALSPDGTRAAAGRSDGSVALVEIDRWSRPTILGGRGSGVIAVAASIDGAWIASAHRDARIRVWDASSGALAFDAPLSCSQLQGLAFSSAGLEVTGTDCPLSDRCLDERSQQVQVLAPGLWQVSATRIERFAPGGTLPRASTAGELRVTARGAVIDVERRAGTSWTPWATLAADAAGWLAVRPEGAAVGAGWGVSEAGATPGAAVLAPGAPTEVAMRDPWADDGPRIEIQRRHSGRVGALAWSADGRWIASGGADRVVMLWDRRTGRKVCTLREHTDDVEALAFSPDGALFASAGDGRALVRRTGDCEPVAEILVDGNGAETVAFTANGRVAVGGSAGKDGWPARVVDVGTGEVVFAVARPEAFASAVAASADGKWFAVVLRAPFPWRSWTEIWDLRTGERLLQTEVREGDESPHLAWNEAHGTFVVASDAAVQVLRPGAREERFALPDGDTSAMAVLSDGSLALGRIYRDGSGPNVAELWDARAKKRLRTLQTDGQHYALAPSPDGRLLALASSTRVRLWDVALDRRVTELGAAIDRSGRIAVSADGRWIASDEAGLWDLARASPIVGDESYEAVTFAGATLVTASWSDKGGVLRWQSPGGEPSREQAVPNGVTALATLEEAVVVGDEAGEIRLVDASGRVSAPLAKLGAPIDQLEAAGGRILARAIADFVVLDATSGKTLLRAEAWSQSATLSPDGARVAYTQWVDGSCGPPFENEQLVVRTISGKADPIVHPLAWGTPTDRMRFSPDGATLLLGEGRSGEGGTLRVLDLATGRVADRIRAHDGAIETIAFSADGTRVHTAGTDGAIRVWAWPGLAPIATLLATRDGHVALLPDGAYAASGSALLAVALAEGDRIWPLEAFDLEQNRPDAVLAALGAASASEVARYAAAREARLRRHRASATSSEGQLRILAAPQHTAEAEAVVRASWRGPAAVLRVEAAGVPVAEVALPASGEPRAVDVRVPLAHGTNEVTLHAVLPDGSRSRPDVARIERLGAHVAGDLWVLSVGVSDYGDPLRDLCCAAEDAADVAVLFDGAARRTPDGASSGPHAFEELHRLVLTDAEASREATLAKGGAFLAQAGVDDSVIVFFAGHGLVEDGVYRFATSDFDFARRDAGGLAWEDILGLLAATPARDRVVLLDTCHAGVDAGEAVAQGTLEPASGARGAQVRVRRLGAVSEQELALSDALFADLGSTAGALVLGAASGWELAYEGETGRNGVFTATLIDVVERSPSATIADVLAQVREEVPARTQGRQTPTGKGDNPWVDFAVACEWPDSRGCHAD